MAQPIWITPAGSLGTIPEGIFFEVPLLAYDPDDPITGEVYYQLISGHLPAGIQCADNGLLGGVPKAIVNIQGVPLPVTEDVTSKFAIRVYTRDPITNVINHVNDRTFTITVTSQNLPEFITPPGLIGTYFDGTQVTNLQIAYTDLNPIEKVTIKLKSGSLPPGLSISSTGLISGLIDRLPPADPTNPLSTDRTYQFTLEATNGNISDLRTYSIKVYARTAMVGTNNFITADNNFITSDTASTYSPVIISPPPGVLATVRNDNFYAIRFVGVDLSGDAIQYQLGFDPGDSTILPGLTLDPNTGWLYGYIPNLGITENTYNFYIRAYKANDPTYISPEYHYTLNIVGPVDTEITWLTDSNLGTINNGSTSTFYVEAINASGIPLQYELQSGSDSLLPQGLQLLPSGHIAGRVSFDTFTLDGGKTTFDLSESLGIQSDLLGTTFDLKFTFTVVAYSVDGLISVNKQFSITVKRVYNEPYDNLYIQVMPPQDDRDLISSLLQNNDIFQSDLIYRADDPNFGKATNLIYHHAFGLTAATYDDYVSSLYKNHYWKQLTLGEIKVARATDTNGNVIYEVVYSRVIDDLLNNQGLSVSKEVTLPYTVTLDDNTQVTTVYPNSLIDMRDQVIDTVGQVSNILPTWMLSKQADGTVLGFTPAVVLAYAKPGKGNQLAYYIRTEFGERLNLVDFEVDRYELDRLLSKNWDPTATSLYHPNGSWVPSPPTITTFDVASGDPTIFDGNSMQFIAPVDMYTNTQAYDKYLVFPKRTILG